MREIRERLTAMHTTSFTEKQAEEIRKVAKSLNTTFSEIVRVCVERELPRLKDRERKRKN